MENPQCENGYTKIANELFEAIIATDLASRKLRCFLAVMRKTYGWHRKRAQISYNEIGRATNIKGQQHVIDAINSLVDDGILLRTKDRSGNSYEINKKYRNWKPFPKEIIIATPENGTSQNQDMPETGHPENGISPTPENGISPTPENGSSTYLKPTDLMPCSEGLKKGKKGKKEDGQNPDDFIPENSPISTGAETKIKTQEDRNKLAEALGIPMVSDSDYLIWQELKSMKDPCSLADVESARRSCGKNRMSYLKNIVCEFRDRRKNGVNEMGQKTILGGLVY